jgi:hypothetical protein
MLFWFGHYGETEHLSHMSKNLEWDIYYVHVWGINMVTVQISEIVQRRSKKCIHFSAQNSA